MSSRHLAMVGPETETEVVKSTSGWAAALRAAEHERPDSFIHDPLAHLLCAPDDHRAITAFPAAPHGSVAVRTRLGDEVLAGAVRAGTRQVVCLGAGSDTRPYRMSLPADLHYYELDLPGQLADRDAILARHGHAVRCRRSTVDTDLTGDWTARLADAGWDPDRPTVWIAEGLLYYLPPRHTDTVLDQVSAASAAGSTVVLDVPHQRFLTADRTRVYRTFLERRRSPYLTGLAAPRTWLRARGWIAEAYLPEALRAGKCSVLPDVPGRLLAYQDIWHVIGHRPRAAARLVA